MNFKRLLTLLLALTMVLSLASCGEKCDGHVDADDDLKCDKCEEEFDDGEEAVGPQQVTFTVKLESGEVLPGIKFTVARGNISHNLVSGANGKAQLTLDVGPYAISYDYDSLPEYCTPDLFGIRVEEGSTDFTITIEDNRPDGSADKPFFINEDETPLSLGAGEEVYYNYLGSAVKTLTVSGDAVTVSYNGETYSAVDGVVTLLIEPKEIGSITTFSIKNTSSAKVDTVIELEALLGSMDNPIELTENSGKATVTSEEIVHYKWTSPKDGVLLLTSPTALNNISITKVLENDVSIISHTDGSGVAYLSVNEGDTVFIAVSVLGLTNDEVIPGAEKEENTDSDPVDTVEVEFLLTVYAGTEAEPVPVLKDEISISIDSGETVAFGSEAGKTVKITDESIVGLTHNGTTYTCDGESEISVELKSPIFVLENKDDHFNGITVTIS